MNHRSPARQSMCRSLARKLAATIRARLCIQPVAASCRIPASTKGLPGHARLPGVEAFGTVVPFDCLEGGAKRSVEDVRVRVKDGVVELAPHELVEPFRDPVARLRFVPCEREARAEARARRDRSEPEERGQPGGSGEGGQVAVEVVAAGGGAQERVQPLARAAAAPPRESTVASVGAATTEPAAGRGPSFDHSSDRPSRRRSREPTAGLSIRTEVHDWRKPGRNPRLPGRVGAVPAPPGPPVRGVDGVGLALAGADLVPIEDDPVLVLAHVDPISRKGAANRPVAALRVGAVVAVPRDERRLAGTRERGQRTVRGAPEDDEPGAGRIELVREVTEASVEKPEPRMRTAVPAKQRVVEDEHGHELARPGTGRRERAVVLGAQIAP